MAPKWLISRFWAWCVRTLRIEPATLSLRCRPMLQALEDRLAPSTTPVAIEFTVTNDWRSGFGANVVIRNTSPAAISNWKLEFDFAANIDQIWNARIVSRVGTRYTLQDMGYNAAIPLGSSVSFGFNGSPGGGVVAPSDYVFNGVRLIPTSTVAPTISVDNVSVTAPSANTSGTSSISSGPLRTSGNQIVDESGQVVRIAGINWFGMETTTYAPHGLWARGYREMMDQMKELGFNTIRLPYSDQLFAPGSTPNGIDFSKNPDLVGLTGLQIMDKIVDYAGQIGLRIILDHHRSSAGDSANDNGLWYDSTYTEAVWIDNWKMLARRYLGNPTIIGADLHNEPHGSATWGSGNLATDWRLAAERAGNAILAINPDWLIIVGGIETGPSGNYWWGGNLSNVRDHPVRLNVANRLVYSPHDYPASVYAQSWFSDPRYPDNLPELWDRTWGYIYREGIAPILLGEFGSRLQTALDRAWANAMIDYLNGGIATGSARSELPSGQLGASWLWWSWNPNSGDTGGILKDDWRTVDSAKLALLEPAQFSFDTPTSAPNTATATFTVSLSQASDRPVTVRYATADQTAIAGEDYRATSGTLTFAPGETTKTVRVTVLSDTTPNPTETFRLVLSQPTNATLEQAVGIGTIIGSGSTPPTPPSEPPIPPSEPPVPPSEPPTAPPSSSSPISVQFTTQSRWDGGFVGVFTITNNGTEAVQGWSIEFDMDAEIVNLWGGSLVTRRGNKYVITAESWNRTIPPGKTVTFGFQASARQFAAPTNVVFNGGAV